MKNIIRVTAIILTMVTVLVTHPFLRLEAKVFDNNIRIEPVYFNPSNNTGNSSLNNNTQIIYGYSVTDPSATAVGAVLGIGVEMDIPYFYVVDFYINFRDAVDSCYITLNFTKPATNNHTTLNFIGDHVRYSNSANTTTSSYISFYVYETSTAHFQLIFPVNVIKDNYNYNYSASNEANIQGREWVENGQNYFKITSGNVSSCTLDTEIDYTSYIDGIEGSLNTISSNVDGLESLLTTTNSSLLNIDQTLSDIKQALYNIRNDNYSYTLAEVWMEGYLMTQSHYYEMPYEYYNNSTGPSVPNTMTTYWFNTYNTAGMYTPTTWNNTYSNWWNTKIIISIKNIGSNKSYWINFPYPIYEAENGDTYSDNLFFMDPINRYLYCLRIYHNWNRYEESRPRVFFTMYRMSIGSEVVTTVNVNDYLSGVYLTNQNIDTTSILKDGVNDIIAAINNINVSVNVSNTQITNEINEYNTTINNVYNIENNISTDLNTQMQQFTPDNTNILQRLNDSSTLLKSVITQINGIDIFTIPVAVALVGIVLMAILG